MKGLKKTIPFFIVLYLTFSFFPFPVFALNCNLSGPGLNSFSDIVCFILGYINQLVLILTAGSLLVFVWGVAKFILSAGDEKKIAEGKTLMFWGVIALFVMVSVWGIIQLFYSDIFGGNIGVPTLPEGTNP